MHKYILVNVLNRKKNPYIIVTPQCQSRFSKIGKLVFKILKKLKKVLKFHYIFKKLLIVTISSKSNILLFSTKKNEVDYITFHQ